MGKILRSLFSMSYIGTIISLYMSELHSYVWLILVCISIYGENVGCWHHPVSLEFDLVQKVKD